MKFDPDTWMNPEIWGHSEEFQGALRVNSRIALASFNPNWKQNAVINARHLSDDSYISDLFGTWDDYSIMCVGAGKSAHDNLDGISDLQKSGIKIVTCDHMLPVLKKHGIQPDMTVSLDPTPRVGMFFEDVDENDTVVMSLIQAPDVVDMVVEKAGHVYFYIPINPFSEASNYLYKNYPKKLFSLRSGSVVGLVATDLCHWMIQRSWGGESIYLIGHDCGWHSEDDIPKAEGHYAGNTLLHSKLPDGRDFYTIPAFASAIPNYYWLFMQQYTLMGIGLFDMSDGALWISPHFSMNSMKDYITRKLAQGGIR